MKRGTVWSGGLLGEDCDFGLWKERGMEAGFGYGFGGILWW